MIAERGTERNGSVDRTELRPGRDGRLISGRSGRVGSGRAGRGETGSIGSVELTPWLGRFDARRRRDRGPDRGVAVAATTRTGGFRTSDWTGGHDAVRTALCFRVPRREAYVCRRACAPTWSGNEVYVTQVGLHVLQSLSIPI